tara:strand:- start:92 stop:502 length:411 start_codon:yes stop_codon:yes gene_type:complete
MTLKICNGHKDRRPKNLIEVHIGVKTWAMFLLEDTFSMLGVHSISVGKPDYIYYCHDLSVDLFFNKKEVPYFIRELERLIDMGLSFGMQTSVGGIIGTLEMKLNPPKIINNNIQPLPLVFETEKIDWDELEREGEI